ncbi:MAG: hypothetical protein WCP34_14925 [Pseudomonadota bacterium]
MVWTLSRKLILLFLLGITVIFIYFNANQSRVLILHSYDAGYSWTRDINVGLKRVLDKHRNITLRWHYMDTKRHPSLEFKRAAAISARKAIEDYQPNVVIGVDDDAHELALKFFANNPRVRIVYAGINGQVTPYGYDVADNVTGILERKPLKAIRDVAMEIARHRGITTPVRILHLGDSSGSVQRDAEWMDAFDWHPAIFAGSQLVATWQDWQKAVEEAPRRADILVVTNYRHLSSSRQDLNPESHDLISYKGILPWTEAHSAIPLIGTNVFNVEDGAGLALGTSPYEQGEESAEMAVDIIENHRSPKTLPPRSSEQFIVAERQEILIRRGLDLPAVYEAFARATDNFTPTPESSSPTPPASSSTLPADAPPSVSKPKETPTAAHPVLDGAKNATVESTPDITAPRIISTPRSPIPAKDAPPPEPAPTLTTLTFNLQGKISVSVRDAKGKIYVRKTAKTGSQWQIKVPLPAQVQLDGTKGVEILQDEVSIGSITQKTFEVRAR